MASYSLEELLGWMKDTSRIYDWDHLLAVSGGPLNSALQDQHAIRLSLGTAIKGISGYFEIPDTPGVVVKHHLSGCALNYPVLSFARASLVSNNLVVSLQLSSGQKIVTYDDAVRSLSSYSLLNGPRLECVVPIVFRAGGSQHAAQVVCDLAREDVTFRFMDAPTVNEQEAGGRLFKQQLQALGEQSVYPLVSFPDQTNPFMQVANVEAGSQSVAAGSEEGALLLYATMAHGQSGSKPSNDSGYKYLIPNDPGGDYGFAAQFSSSLVNRAGFGVALLETFGAENVEFVEEPGTGRATGLRARAGTLTIAATADYKDDVYEYRSEPFDLSATLGGRPLTADFERTRALQHWQTRGTVKVDYRPRVNGTTWTTYTAEFSFSLEQVFQMIADEFAGGEVGGEVFVPQTRNPEVVPISGLPVDLPEKMRQRIVAFVGHTVKTAVLEQYSRSLTAKAAQVFLDDTEVADDTLLQPSVIALPLDYAAFGTLAAAAASFQITPAHPMLLAGERLKFSVEPERSVRFTLDNLDSANPGTIDEEGNYRAPPGHTLSGPSAQILLIAEDTQTHETCVTTITVLGQTLVVFPDIQVCNQGASVELSARSISGGRLQWAIDNPVAGESGTLSPDETSQHCTYTAASQVAEKTYVFDKIIVTDPDSGHTVSSRILALHRNPGLTIKPDPQAAVPGQLQLLASANNFPISEGVEWAIEFDGPGTIDEHGLYREDGFSNAPFVLITAVFDSGNPIVGTLLGYFILPLPLANAERVFLGVRR
ncbi:hypothetical protein [Pseudomonas sp. MWU13-2105]|uniref:hypothetical protein n=1 Tax=Pseudomonas sp. MWU13-2105 TaxID=2935074 RepID=UPI00200D3A05|nr:hypothetical protein [Pseudomonas sp. MWU13-2105]